MRTVLGEVSLIGKPEIRGEAGQVPLALLVRLNAQPTRTRLQNLVSEIPMWTVKARLSRVGEIASSSARLVAAGSLAKIAARPDGRTALPGWTR